jgi:AraC-like DNA-binding protein
MRRGRASAGLDKFHLVRAFRAEVGVPPYEFLTHLRIARARELLRRGVLVADAAQAVSQLHRHFRRIVGVTPGAYAKSFVSGKPPTSPKTRRPRRRMLAPWTHAEATKAKARP